MSKLHLLLLGMLTVATVSATAQAKPASPLGPETLQQLRHLHQAALEDDYAYRQAAHLTDNIGPRLAGSPQAAAAVEYVAAELRKL
ncbi:MAG TPA: hypothetical protein VFC29_00110, partial [Candidatus Limnocylindrales bacterium]|nr:hypothetical protein [Candidatus Limnocylindrales bacterium]